MLEIIFNGQFLLLKRLVEYSFKEKKKKTLN